MQPGVGGGGGKAIAATSALAAVEGGAAVAKPTPAPRTGKSQVLRDSVPPTAVELVTATLNADAEYFASFVREAFEAQALIEFFSYIQGLKD